MYHEELNLQPTLPAPITNTRMLSIDVIYYRI